MMALLWMDGFEGYDDAWNVDCQGVVARRYAVGSSRIRLESGRFGGYSLVPHYTSSWIQTPVLTTDDTLIVGFALRFWGIPNNCHFFWMLSEGTQGMGIGVDDSGVVRVYRGGSIIAESTEILIRSNKWVYVEFKVVCDNTNGSYELRINGETILSDSGIDTQQNQPYHDQVFIRGYQYSASYTPHIDDYYICDSTGSKHNDFLGQQRISPIWPNADTADIDWTPSAAVDHYTLVDEVDPDDDSEYVEDTVTDNEDIYEYSDISDLDIVEAVCLCTEVRVTDVTSYDLKTVVKSGGTKYDSAADTIGSTEYLTNLRLMADDPDTGTDWAVSGVNGLEMGVKVG
jgi:hypothetical protein